MARATLEQRRAVLNLVEKHQNAVLNLSLDESATMVPILDQAQAELGTQLRRWIERTPDGELRWSAQKYRNALMQIHSSQKLLEAKLSGTLDESMPAAQALAVDHLVEQVGVFSKVFEGSVQKLNLDAAKLVATGRSFIVPRIRTSAARYAGMVGRDLQKRLATDILKGSFLSETIDRLQESGGPKGLVALQGIVGEKDAIVEQIPEGLFARYRYWAERLVRTETTSAYSLQATDAMREAAKRDHDIKRRWFANGTACAAVCAQIDGQVIGLHESYESPIGYLEGPPAHPFCGCSETIWKDDWPDLFGSLLD